MSVPVNIAGEGPTDLAVMRRMLNEVGLQCGIVYHGNGRKTGKHSLDPKLRGYMAGAQHTPWFVLRDLDGEGCVVSVRQTLIGQDVPSSFVFRIAVNAVEAWLMADHSNLADHLGVRSAHLPSTPESAARPKDILFAAAAKFRRATIKRSVSEKALLGRKISPEFFETMMTFIQEVWVPDEAAKRSKSLFRAMSALRRLRS